MKNKKFLVGAVCALLISAYWYSNRDAGASEELRFQTSPISQGTIESIVNTAGTLSPVVTVDVGSELSGLVSELNADFNSEVKSGDIIARIDDRTIRARLKQSEADLASSEASLEQQKASLARAQADVTLANAELKRQEEIRKRGLNSQVDLDQAIANAQIAQANLELAVAQVTSAEASIQQSQAQLEQTQLDLERTYIRSPVDGTVIDRQVDIGQTVAASLSAPILFQIAQDLTKMQIEADVDEADIGKISEGLVVRFSVDAFPDTSFDGQISQVRKASTITNNVVTYKVIVTADNRRQLLLPGMTANVDIILGIKEDVLRVDNSALRFNPPEELISAEVATEDPNEQIQTAINELGLNKDVSQQVNEIYADMTAAMQEARNSAGTGGGDAGGGNNREAMGQIRQRATNQLQAILSTDQLAAIEASMRGGRGEGGRRGGGDGMSPGQVWVLDGDSLKAVNLRTGLSDDQYTEISTEELSVDDHVVVRIARNTQ